MIVQSHNETVKTHTDILEQTGIKMLNSVLLTPTNRSSGLTFEQNKALTHAYEAFEAFKGNTRDKQLEWRLDRAVKRFQLVMNPTLEEDEEVESDKEEEESEQPGMYPCTFCIDILNNS